MTLPIQDPSLAAEGLGVPPRRAGFLRGVLRERKAAVTEPKVKGEEPVERKVHRDRNQANDHGKMPFIERVEGGRQHFHARGCGP